MELWDLIFVQQSFGLALIPFLYILLLLFGMGMFTLCPCILAVYIGAQDEEFALSFRQDFGLRPFSRAGTVNTLVTLKKWVKFILPEEIQMSLLGAKDRRLIVQIENVSQRLLRLI